MTQRNSHRKDLFDTRIGGWGLTPGAKSVGRKAFTSLAMAREAIDQERLRLAEIANERAAQARSNAQLYGGQIALAAGRLSQWAAEGPETVTKNLGIIGQDVQRRKAQAGKKGAEIAEQAEDVRLGLMNNKPLDYSQPYLQEVRAARENMGGLERNGRAAVRGGSDSASMGTSNIIGATLEIGDTPYSFAQNMERQRYRDELDERDVPLARLSGQAVGSFVGPGAAWAGSARTAGGVALRNIAVESAKSGLHGFASTPGSLEDRWEAARRESLQGALGSGLGGLVTRGGRIVLPGALAAGAAALEKHGGLPGRLAARYGEPTVDGTGKAVELLEPLTTFMSTETVKAFQDAANKKQTAKKR